MYYIASETSGEEVFRAVETLDRHQYIYAYRDPVAAVVHALFRYDRNSGASAAIDETQGRMALWESCADAFRKVYGGVSCSLYEVGEETFLPGLTGWDAELISAGTVPVIREERIKDVCRFLLDAAEAGLCECHSYSEREEYRKAFEEVSERMDARDGEPVFVIEDGTLLRYIPGDDLPHVVIPEGVRTIGDGAFSCSRVDKVTIPDGVTAIEEAAFYECTLFEAVIPEGVTRIGSWAFGCCEWMRSLSIPESVNRIDPWAVGYHRGPDAWADNWDPTPNNYVTTIYGKRGTEAERYAKENETFRGVRILRFVEI